MSYLRFEESGLSESGLTKRWIVTSKSNGDMLGRISWLSRWRKYVFNTESHISLDEFCMLEIIEFICTVTLEHKKKL